MERLDGYRSNSILYVDEQNYLYTKNKVRNNKLYLVCRLRNTCMARCRILDNGRIIHTTQHNHEADDLAVETARFMTNLRRRASQENTALNDIFGNEERRFPNAARNIGGYINVKSSMARSRRSGTPPLPATLQEFQQFILDRRWNARYGCDLGPATNQFYRTYLQCEDGSEAVIFGSETCLRHVREHGVMIAHMDATFKVVPRTTNIYQLFTIHTVYMNMTFPVIYVLMTRKTRQLYQSILTYLKNTLLPGVRVDSVMADYETALRISVVTILPGTRLRGCWFHYTKALYKKSRPLGLQGNPDSKRIVKMAMALPLLPEDQIRTGLEILERLSVANVRLLRFLNYIRQQWLPLNISVHGQSHRTNNLVESFHRDLYRLVSRPHPNIWVLIERLQQMEHGKAIDLERLVEGHMLPRRRRVRYLILEQRIQRAQEMLINTGDVRRFLAFMSHSVERINHILARGQADEDVEVEGLEPDQGPEPAQEPVQDQEPEPPAAVNVPVDMNMDTAIPREQPCVACLTNQRTNVFLDCRHLCVCDGCVTQFRVSAGNFDNDPSSRCPQCRTAITQPPLRIFV